MSARRSPRCPPPAPVPARRSPAGRCLARPRRGPHRPASHSSHFSTTWEPSLALLVNFAVLVTLFASDLPGNVDAPALQSRICPNSYLRDFTMARGGWLPSERCGPGIGQQVAARRLHIKGADPHGRSEGGAVRVGFGAGRGGDVPTQSAARPRPSDCGQRRTDSVDRVRAVQPLARSCTFSDNRVVSTRSRDFLDDLLEVG